MPRATFCRCRREGARRRGVSGSPAASTCRVRAAPPRWQRQWKIWKSCPVCMRHLASAFTNRLRRPQTPAPVASEHTTPPARSSRWASNAVQWMVLSATSEHIRGGARRKPWSTMAQAVPVRVPGDADGLSARRRRDSTSLVTLNFLSEPLVQRARGGGGRPTLYHSNAGAAAEM